MRRASLVNKPMWGEWLNIKATWPLMTLLLYKTSSAMAQSQDFLLDSQYVSYGLSHFSEGLPLLLAENFQTPLDIHTNYFVLPLPISSGPPFSGFLG